MDFTRLGFYRNRISQTQETIAFVLGVIRSSIFSGSIVKKSGSISTNTGQAPTYKAQLAEAIKLKGDVITSSDGPI